MPAVIGILVVVALLCVNAFFVAAEFSLVSVDRERITSKKSYRAQVASKLLERLTFHLSGSQLGITGVALLLGFVAEPAIAELIEPAIGGLFGDSTAHGTSIALALVLATVLHMVIGEQVPKIFSLSKPLGTVLTLAPLVRIYSTLVYPVVMTSNKLANVMLKGLGVEPTEELQNVRSRGDLEDIFISSGAGGTIDGADVDLLTRSLHFGQKIAMDALVPRMSVESVETDESLSDLVARVLESGHSRFPVTGGDLDDVKGVVHIKSVHKIPRSKWDKMLISELMGDVLAIPETLPLADLLRQMTKKRSPLAVVVDEHGGTSGIVTAEDILEQIVGAIADEHDELEGEKVETIGNGEFLFPGAAQIEELKKSCGFSAPEGPFETLGGFVMHRLQRIPQEKELFHHKGWWFEVMEMDGHRIANVKVIQPRNLVEPDKVHKK